VTGVVVHLAEAGAERQSAVLRNVLNLRADLGPDVAVELVAHGPGVELLTGESGLREAVSGLGSAGVRALACRNTLAARGLTPEDLLPDVGTVGSGVGHLARRQLEGWAYVRP
jgi:intracellular sulfur oxidation DsrE/DsrF family protein